MTPLIPIVLGAGALFAYKKAKKKTGMTPERKKVFEAAIKNLEDPKKLRALAATFDKEGLKAAGDELRKRAKLREMPPKKKEQRRQAYKKGMSSSNPEAVNKLATAFQAEGAYGAAQNLRDYSKGISAKVTSIFSAPRSANPAVPMAQPKKKSGLLAAISPKMAAHLAARVGEEEDDGPDSVPGGEEDEEELESLSSTMGLDEEAAEVLESLEPEG
jgi:hypothetical protein